MKFTSGATYRMSASNTQGYKMGQGNFVLSPKFTKYVKRLNAF